MPVATDPEARPPQIWWANAIFFVGTHLAAAYGIYRRPLSTLSRETALLTFVCWQLACFGITIGYHRLYSHRAFRAPLGVRVVLAVLGTSALQGSIKWWCLRHRLHHRFTDDDKHDPYSATRGLFFSHVGWIFYKPQYPKIDLIDRADLDRDPVVRLQHRYFVPLAIFFSFVLPTAIGLLWNDPRGAFIYGGLVARLMTWHCTFLINSLAHWDGLQPFSDENTSRTNLILALLTCGEGNHNFHAFPHDFRSGPSALDWDPSKWIILALHRLGLATGLRRARALDITDARSHMRQKQAHGAPEEPLAADWDGPTWGVEQVRAYVRAGGNGDGTGNGPACVVLVDGFAVDVTAYMGEHPGGSALLRKFAVPAREPQGGEEKGEGPEWTRATWAFRGGLNNHSLAARRRMAELRVAQMAVAM
ncbi:hypothetical protein DENSPDRAFT_776372 [Dentipellis sp. KUC8613]|nr:hypothetical protein DENSPDRAFT_776372 [Dentipellis sp. KUC8613]